MRVAAFQHYGRICTSQIFGPPHVALEPLGTWHWCQHVAPCSQRAAQAVARVPEHHNVEGCSFQLPQLCLYTVYTKDFQTSIPEENRKKNMLRVQYTVLTQTRGSVSLDLLCFHSFWSVTFTEISIYILKDTHIKVFLIRKMLFAIISFSFFLQVQEFFVLLGTTVVLCCLIKVSKLMTFLLL